MILFIRDNECFEPRVNNYLNYFENNSIEYHVIAWNRNGTAKSSSKITFLERRAEYGKRLANIPNKIIWMLFVMKEIIKHRKNCSLIHACDIDAILPALFIGKLLGKKVIFDIFDWISSLTGKGFVYKFVDLLQNFCYKHADAVILCEEERKSQANTTNKNVMVLPNIPNDLIQFDQTTLDTVQEQRKDYSLTISYVGVFDRDRGLENLLEVVSQRPHILLNIAGFGVLDEMIKEYAKKFKNIHYWGRVEYTVGQAIMKQSDLIAAMYHLTSPLHKYAAPNKYYESLLLKVPMITTTNTLVGSKASKYDTGFVIEEDIKALESILDDSEVTRKAYSKSLNCEKVWLNVYSSYYDDFMKSQYLKLLE